MSNEQKALNSLLALEFSRYGACYQVMNKITSEDKIEVFEVSPTPQGGILLLLSDKKAVLEHLLQATNQELKSMTLDCALINDINMDVLNTYLSQNKPVIKDDMFFYEIDGVCKALKKAQEIKNQGGNLIDFRVLRSVNHRCILVSDRAAESAHEGLQLTKPNELVRSYFQI